MTGISDNTTSFTNSFAFVDATTTQSQHPPYNTSPSLQTELRRLSLNPKDKLVQLEYDMNTTAKTFTINDEGIQWTDGTTTHLTALDRITQISKLIPAVQPQATINSQILAVDNTLLVLDDITTPTCAVNIQADNTGGVGTHFGIDLVNTTNNNDFEIRNDPSYEGSVVFKDFGSGSGTTQTGIKQGTISLTDTATPLTTSFSPTTLTSGASSRTWADIITNTGSANTLQQVLVNGNTATGSTANITLTDTDAGGQANPIFTLNNTNATGSVAMEVYKNKPTAGITGDVLFNQSVYGKDSGNAKQEYTRISHTLRDASSGVEDGSIEFSAFVNGSVATFIQINGNENEVNVLKPLDMTGNSLKTSLTNLNIEATTSTGTGQIILTPKVTSNVNVNGNLLMTTDKTITLNDSSPNAVQTVIGDGKILVNDVTNGLTTFQDQSTFGLQNGNPTTMLYSINGFACNDNSIQCNSSNGFYMNYGSPLNYTQLDLDSFEMYNSGGSLIDQITMQNNGVGNPVFGILSTDNTNPSPLLKQAGISNQGIGFTYSDVGAGTNTQLQLTNNTGGSGQLSYTNAIDPSQLLSISSNCTIELSTTQDLQLTGANLQSGSSSGSASQYLRIKLNGTFYKIALDND